MGGRNGSYNQIQHQRSNSTCSTTTSFLPFLCRISMKDAAKIQQTSPCFKKNDPSSPKVSCIGQIKHHHNNNKLIIPSTTTTTTGKPKYTKLKKLFSGRNLLMTTPTTTTTTTKCSRVNDNNKIPKIESKDQRRNTKLFNHPHHHHHYSNDNCAVVVPLNLAELDPPLPVVQPSCRRRGEEEVGSLWKRRGLGSLKIQEIQLPNKKTTTLLLQPSSVSL